MSSPLHVTVASGDEQKPKYVIVCDSESSLKIGEIVPKVSEGSLIFEVGGGSSGALSMEELRKIGASIVNHDKDGGSVGVDVSSVRSDDPKVIGQGLSEGAILADYRFDRHRSEMSLPTPKSAPLALVLLSEPGAVVGIQEGVDRAIATTKATLLARDLVNEPPSLMTPSKFAEVAQEVSQQGGLEIRIWDEEDCKREGLGGLLGVARGSAQPPRMIRLHYVPEGTPKGARVALVGKGITFDSGGLSLKSGAGMMTMKIDMSGASAVLSAMSVLRELGCEREVFGYMALTENMPSGTAQKPGDVLVTRNKKTIEVLNTDAEGRLVLADALSLAVEDGCEEIVDIATLTGACVVALGDEIAGILGSSKELINEVQQAGEAAGETYWELPLPQRYKKHIESTIADMKNIGKTGSAGTISAALLLAEFVGDAKWAHLDIAGPAYTDSPSGYLTAGATGFGARTFVEWLTA